MAETIDRTEARRRWGRAYGSWYWKRRQGAPQAERVALILEYRHYRKVWETAPPETNERGNEIYRDEDADHKLGILQGHDRYYYDFTALTDWRQFDTSQDAHYFGVWVSVERLMTFTYAEGDRILVVCPDRAHLKTELEDAVRFYGDPPPAFIVIGQDGSRSDLYDPRPTVED
jgi:hypothetical protein